MYLQLAEAPRKSTWVSAYNRKGNYVPAHKRALNAAPIQYLLNEDGVYTREDVFDYLPLNEYCKMLSEQGFNLNEISLLAGKRKERKEQKFDLKVAKKESKIDKRESKSDLKRSKGAAKETRADKKGSGGGGAKILDTITTNLPQILDTVGNVVGVVKNGEVIPVTPESGGGAPSGGGSASVSFWDKSTDLPVVGNVSNKKIVGGLVVLTVAGIAAKKLL